MSGSGAKKIEMIANIAIITVAILISAVLVKTYFVPDPNVAAINPAEPSRRGAKVDLSGVDWAVNGRTLVLALSSSCRYCTESTPFYKQIVEKHAGLKKIAVFPQPVEEGKAYLRQHGLAIEDVQQDSLDSLGIGGTPTLILVDEAGTVVEIWTGKLDVRQEAQVLAML